jgi:hypothetical protein
VRDTLALYNWSGDGLRIDDVVSAFCEDGTLEIRGREPIVGREALAGFFAGFGSAPDAPAAAAAAPGARRIVRHNVTNLRFLEVAPDRARVASYFTVLTELGLDHYGRYRDTLVPVGDAWLLQHRFVATDWRSPDSTMAREDA